MQKQFSISEAKNRLPKIIHYVEKGPCVELTRRGAPVAVLLSIQEYERLRRKYTGFWSAVSEFRRKIEDDGIEITDRDFGGLRDLSTGRKERAGLSSKGMTPSFVDGQIAAISVVNGLILVTRNVDDFKQFQGLKVENWHAA